MAPGGEGLAEVRELFGRADADANGRLDRREAVRAQVGTAQLLLGDFDRDGTLDLAEFCVARRRELSRRRQLAGLDLIAESTRIQALWRARSAQAERERVPSVGVAGLGRGRSGLLRPPGATRGVASPPVPSGPAQARLWAALHSSAVQTAERARRAQILLELRRRERIPR